MAFNRRGYYGKNPVIIFEALMKEKKQSNKLLNSGWLIEPTKHLKCSLKVFVQIETDNKNYITTKEISAITWLRAVFQLNLKYPRHGNITNLRGLVV